MISLRVYLGLLWELYPTMAIFMTNFRTWYSYDFFQEYFEDLMFLEVFWRPLRGLDVFKPWAKSSYQWINIFFLIFKFSNHGRNLVNNVQIFFKCSRFPIMGKILPMVAILPQYLATIGKYSFSSVQLFQPWANSCQQWVNSFF